MLKGEVHSLVPRCCVDFGLAKAQMTSSPQRLGETAFWVMSLHCLTATGNAVSVMSHSRHRGSHVSIGKDRERLIAAGVCHQAIEV